VSAYCSPAALILRAAAFSEKARRASRVKIRLQIHDEIAPQLSDIVHSSLIQMARFIRARKISPLELVDAHIAQIDRVNPSLNAFANFAFDQARKEARTKETKPRVHARGAKNSPGRLLGVPITIKSSIDVAGFPCECGSRIRKGIRAAADAPIVRRLRAAGAIILGNTNVPEFLMAWETDNLLYGRTNNPWDLARTPGGSSGGEAAAIAVGCSAGGVGSDGGGSIRVPAHFSGICGLKPTPGRIPSTGHFPGSAGPFAQLGVVGPMARTIGDVQKLFEVMAGPDPGDSCAAPVPLRKWSDREIRKLRVGFFESDDSAPVTPETAAAVRKAANALAQQGFRVEEWRPPNLDQVWQLWWNLFGRAGQMAFAPALDGRDADMSPILKEFRAWVAAESPLSAIELLDTLLDRDAVRTKFLAKMEEFPILLCPVSSIPAFRHGEREWAIRGQKLGYLKAMSYSQWFNLLGNPAAVVPVGQSPEGLPVGVQVVGRPWQEEEVLGVAVKIEEVCGNPRRPPVS
jgi:Asp-tRNA(Asn)/Glu-tRNA(Gln) amidotransferase A subunit family amidase